MNTSDGTATPRNTSTPPWTEHYWTVSNAADRASDLGPGSFRVLRALISYADGAQRRTAMQNARPGRRLLVEATGLTPSTVFKALADLRERGWIVITDKGGGKKATTYTIQLPPSREAPYPTSRIGLSDQSDRGLSDWSDPTEALTEGRPEEDPFHRGCAARQESATGEGEGSAAPVRRVQDFPDEPGVIRTEGDAFPDEVLQAVIDAGNAAKDDRWPLLALHDVIAPKHGEHFAEWLIDGPVHFKAGLEPYEASQKLRTLFNTAPKHGVFPENPPAPRNVARIDHTDREQAAERERFRRSIADAQADAPTEADATAEAEAHGYDEQAWVGHDLEARHREMERIRARSADEDARKRRLMEDSAPTPAQEPQEAR